ncbi:unnamed protein product [Leptidea sinapis]|uniref:Ska2 N-terminal domain-containing protein n=1 Tax=Leptidea sinapis TaxID=189913 RepID=A0A5E4QK53_9NEOP|nr:unnamed protein product [Leptidea sinapis]
MSDKEITMEELDDTVKQTNEQLEMLDWKLDSGKELVVPINHQDVCLINLIKSVSEVRSDYQQLRRELIEVQALQRELSSRLRSQLRLVHSKFARLRQKIAAASPPR